MDFCRRNRMSRPRRDLREKTAWVEIVEKAFLQYLRSLQRAGISHLPVGGESVEKQLARSLEATRQWNASANSSRQDTASAIDLQVDRAPSHAAVKEAPAPPGPADLDRPARLELIRQDVAACERCPELVANRSRTVFGVGDPHARLCFMGEAPGADEDRQGEPFVGAAGQLLTRIINACKLDRSEVYILNTLKCRPPNNRNPTDLECSQCRSFLDQQLEVIQPEYICCLGGIAAKHLLETPSPVGRLRGRVHDYRGMRVVVTYHPAYLLRNPDAKREVWNDMKFLMNEMGHDIS